MLISLHVCQLFWIFLSSHDLLSRHLTYYPLHRQLNFFETFSFMHRGTPFATKNACGLESAVVKAYDIYSPIGTSFAVRRPSIKKPQTSYRLWLVHWKSYYHGFKSQLLWRKLNYVIILCMVRNCHGTEVVNGILTSVKVDWRWCKGRFDGVRNNPRRLISYGRWRHPSALCCVRAAYCGIGNSCENLCLQFICAF